MEYTKKYMTDIWDSDKDLINRYLNYQSKVGKRVVQKQ